MDKKGGVVKKCLKDQSLVWAEVLPNSERGVERLDLVAGTFDPRQGAPIFSPCEQKAGLPISFHNTIPTKLVLYLLTSSALVISCIVLAIELPLAVWHSGILANTTACSGFSH